MFMWGSGTHPWSTPILIYCIPFIQLTLLRTDPILDHVDTAIPSDGSTTDKYGDGTEGTEGTRGR